MTTRTQDDASLPANQPDAFHRRCDELFQCRAAIDVSPDLIGLTDVEAVRLIYVDQAACRNAGYTNDEFLKVRPSTLIGLPRKVGLAG